MSGFLTHLEQLTSLADATRAAIAEHCQTVRYRKRHQLLAAGQTGQHLYYVEAGLAKIFHLQDGREVVDWFSDAHTLLCTLPSFIAHQPSRCTIQLLEDSELTSISLAALEALCLRFPDLAQWRQRWVEQVVLLLQNRHHARQEPSAARRYASFAIEYSSLLPRVPLGDLASYLGHDGRHAESGAVTGMRFYHLLKDCFPEGAFFALSLPPRPPSPTPAKQQA